jgi:hypothetical protein
MDSVMRSLIEYSKSSSGVDKAKTFCATFFFSSFFNASLILIEIDVFLSFCKILSINILSIKIDVFYKYCGF